GFNCSDHAPMQDLARTVRLLEQHQDEFNIDMEGYAVIGFSAGGNMAGIYGSKEWGYDFYHTKKPGALILAYPWTNVNHWLQHPYWNIFIGLLGLWLSERGNICMFRYSKHFLRKNRETLCVQNYVDTDYPPTYMFAGGNDVLVPSHAHTDVMEKALKENHIPHMYEKFFAVPHGIGLGEKTSAEGWIETALEFWHSHI
nr:alpha/beta hydrolase [Lachnospiraceae bacterium]